MYVLIIRIPTCFLKYFSHSFNFLVYCSPKESECSCQFKVPLSRLFERLFCSSFADLREFGTKLEKEVLDCDTLVRKYVKED